jgi:hypothetical protein
MAAKRAAIIKNGRFAMKSCFLISILFSFSAMACPYLAGDYKNCRIVSATHSTPPSSIKVEQVLINKFPSYTLTISDEEGEVRKESYIADGKTKIMTNTDSDTGIVVKTHTHASCKDQTLIVKMDATIDDEPFAKMSITMSRNGGQMTQVYQGESMGEEINDTVICN